MTPLPINLQPHAEEEARSARRWYTQGNSEAGERFMAELDRAIQAISEFPERWPRYLHDTRRLHLHRFPYWVVYRVKPESVLIVAVAHDRRRPGYWRSRK